MRSNVRPKVRQRKVNALATCSRKFTVKNITKTISPVVKHKRYGAKIDESMVITNPLSGNKFMQTNPHTVTGKFGVSITVYDWVPLEEFKKNSGKLWEIPEGGFKQPKRLIKCKNRKYSKSYHITKDGITYECTHRNKPTQKNEYESTGHNDFVKYFSNHPYTVKPLTKEAYWEKLVAHKLEKWERKNPKPQQDLFDKVEDWERRRFLAEQRFRDVIVSVYDKLKVVAVDDEKEILLATIKDDADRMKVLKTASKVQDAFHKKHPKVLNYKLYDHKPKKVLMETHKLAA